MAHFFATFREREISGLRYMATGDGFHDPTYDLPGNVLTNLSKMVTKLPSLQLLLVVNLRC